MNKKVATAPITVVSPAPLGPSSPKEQQSGIRRSNFFEGVPVGEHDSTGALVPRGQQDVGSPVHADGVRRQGIP